MTNKEYCKQLRKQYYRDLKLRRWEGRNVKLSSSIYKGLWITGVLLLISSLFLEILLIPAFILLGLFVVLIWAGAIDGWFMDYSQNKIMSIIEKDNKGITWKEFCKLSELK